MHVLEWCPLCYSQALVVPPSFLKILHLKMAKVGTAIGNGEGRSRKVLRTPQSFTILCDQLLDDDVVDIWNRARATVSCTFSQPHLPKVLRDPQFFNIFKWKSSSCYSPVHFLSTTFPDRDTQPRKQRLSSGDHGSHFRARVFSSLNSRIPNLMMMCLTWWCGWHNYRDDDVVAVMVRKLAMTIVRNSEVS